MITEDYVSFEVAKLLKEKGFDEPCIRHWDCDDHSLYGYNDIPISNSELQANEYNGYAAPTLQMAMKWLREEHKIAINIYITCKKTISYAFDIYDFEIIHPNKFVGGTIDLREQQFDFKTYEEAVEAALKYSLENLI